MHHILFGSDDEDDDDDDEYEYSLPQPARPPSRERVDDDVRNRHSEHRGTDVGTTSMSAELKAWRLPQRPMNSLS